MEKLRPQWKNWERGLAYCAAGMPHAECAPRSALGGAERGRFCAAQKKGGAAIQRCSLQQFRVLAQQYSAVRA